MMVKRITIFIKLLAELLNEFAGSITNRALLVLGVTVIGASLVKQNLLSWAKD